MISLIESSPTRKLLNQGFLVVKLKSSPRKIHGRHHDLVEYYYVPFIVNTIHPDFPYSLFITRFVSVTRSVVSAKHTTAYPFVAPSSPQFSSCVAQSLAFSLALCWPLVVFWGLNCLSFFELWLLITPLVSSNFSLLRKSIHDVQRIVYIYFIIIKQVCSLNM